jgi:hypothetical protein
MALENDAAKPWTCGTLGTHGEDGADGDDVCSVNTEELDIPDYYKWTKAQLDDEAKIFVTMTEKACAGTYKMTLHDKACFECFKRAFARLTPSDVEVKDYKTYTMHELQRELERLKRLVDATAQGHGSMPYAEQKKLEALANESKRRNPARRGRRVL